MEPSAATNSCNLNCNAISCTTTGVVCVYCYRPEASASRSNSSICDRARRTCRWDHPVAPRGHKKRKLNSAEQAKLCSSLDRNPFATNQQLRARVGNKIAASTVSRDLARAKPRFTAKVVQWDNWREEARSRRLHGANESMKTKLLSMRE